MYNTMRMLNAISALLFLALVAVAYQLHRGVETANAIAVYNLVRDSRAFSVELDRGLVGTGHEINFHFSIYHLQEAGVIGRDLRRPFMMDLCHVIKNRDDFDHAWSSLKEYYPANFRHAVEAIASIGECSEDAIAQVAGSISVL